MPKEIYITDSVPGQVYIFNPPGSRKVKSASRGGSGLTAKVVIEGTYVEPPVDPPIDPVPTITEGPTVNAITESGASISWKLSEPGTGWVEYGMSPALGSETVHETTLRSDHTQQINGLLPDAICYFRVRGLDNIGQPYVGSLANFRTKAVVTPPPPTGDYPPITTWQPPRTNSDPRPAYRVPATDSTYGTKVTRVSDFNLRRNVYVSQVSYSKDGDKLIFFPAHGGSQWQNVLRLLDGITYADRGPMQGGADFAQWSSLDNNRIYGSHNAAGKIVTNTGLPGAAWLDYATIAGEPFLSINYGMLSRNDRVALTTNRNRVYVYDLPNKAVVGYADVGFTPSSAQISIDGEYVQINSQNNGPEYMFKVPGSNTAMQPMSGGSYGPGGLIASNGSHMVMSELADGTSVSVSLRSGGEIRRCDNNSKRALFPVTTAFNSGSGGHLSYCNRKKPGWIVASTGVASSHPGHDALVAINLDDPTKVMYYAEAHACRVMSPTPYNATPFAIGNPDLTHVLWGSAWDGDVNTQVFAFVAEAQ